MDCEVLPFDRLRVIGEVMEHEAIEGDGQDVLTLNPSVTFYCGHLYRVILIVAFYP